MSGAIIKVHGLHKYFGPLHVIKGVDLEVMAGEVVAIMGPSGSGKSTFLRCLNFLEELSAGSIEIDGVEVKASQPTGKRNKQIRAIRQKALMVFQEFNLFPHMTVLGNIIEAAVTVKGVSKEQATARAEELLSQLGIPEKRDEYPSRLASGQQQRVAIARSLCLEPRIMLFDAPTAMLDVLDEGVEQAPKQTKASFFRIEYPPKIKTDDLVIFDHIFPIDRRVTGSVDGPHRRAVAERV